ncbi:phosphoglycerate mutase [Oceanicola granulosus HTCC2516]|uniref:Phosphoglycerate mutase n=1 Tax=Oceanicola granulosus (strain ATCC BAA-861 / DSM 15982 / KCTC 12143 / HTCC2516) TaxID=314256 RepID=Q2CFW2_OCEGH|nr:histidine phosphatase family protein [Oceanicola granulosus]EAR51580.1 phosphoglycerate mutase [Oceanicola granulosus HTCC2516]
MTPLPDLYVLRHGETEWNRLHRWQGVLDSPLTPEGEAQARAMGRLLRGLGVGPAEHRLFVSPQGRARRTAELIAAELGGWEPVVEPRLAEIGVGRWAGVDRAVIDAEAALPPGAHFLDLYRAAPGGEPFEALYARVSDFLAALEGPAVVVTHGITSRFLRTAALGLGLGRLAELPGGQGVVHRVRDGRHETLAPGERGEPG